MGVARGIKTFQRYGYIERNGQSNLAVPLGRFEVTDNKPEHLVCIDDLDVWLQRLRREARKKNVAARLAITEKHLVDTLFTVTERPLNPAVWQCVLICLADIEGVMRYSTDFGAGPISRLCPDWVSASDDGTPEFRLALTFALQAAHGKSTDSIRRHWLPLDEGKGWRSFLTTGTGSATQARCIAGSHYTWP